MTDDSVSRYFEFYRVNLNGEKYRFRGQEKFPSPLWRLGNLLSSQPVFYANKPH
jgi:hypothetical protein